MAWVNSNLPPLTIAPVTNDDIFINGATQSGQILKSGIDYAVQTEQSFWQSRANSFVIGDSSNGIYVRIESGNYCLELYHNGSKIFGDISLDWNWGDGPYYYGILFAGYDDETQKGTIGYARRYYNFPPSDYPFSNTDAPALRNRTDVYEVLKNIDIPTHNWQSVPSIVGKSAVSLDLSVILDINDGEAVTTSDASKFDLNNDSNVITLVNNVINQNE